MSPLTSELMLSHERQPLVLQHAQTLRIRRGGKLVVRRGRVWLTVDGEAQDRVIGAGDLLVLSAGHRAVIEPWSFREGAEVCWCADAEASRVATVLASVRRWLAGFRPQPGATAR